MSSKEFHSTIKNLKHIRQFVEQELLKNSVPQNIINEIKIVIGEATANIYKYGYLKNEDIKNKILAKVLVVNNEIEIHLFDNGVKVDKSMVKPRDLSDVKPGKIGSYFIGKLVDYFDWSDKKNDWVNHLILKKKIN